MADSKQVKKYQRVECPNCTYPFSGYEKFCPECGQKNEGKKLQFTAFIGEVFKGFISWDSKFWKTIFPLVSKPGKVPEYYVTGKRNRYVNPFRFYIIVSILFFLTIGIVDVVGRFDSLRKGEHASELIKQKDNTEIKMVNDSVPKKIDVEINDSRIFKFVKFQKKHPKLSINDALDSLSLSKTFSNKFWYSRAKLINEFSDGNEESTKQFVKEVMSYVSIALFLMLPVFCFFLKLLYFKNKYTYVEHLVFVFYTQSVFFILLTVFQIIGFFTKSTTHLLNFFTLLFLIYLFVAMKRFYKQSYGKTFLKFCLVNSIYVLLSVVGSLSLLMITFAIY